jgi:shikimate dehydrogenase
MTAPVPSVVVSLPGRSLDALRREISEARIGGADLAEIRLDRLGVSDRERIAELFPSELPLMATLRSRSEGGEGPDAPEERSEILRRAAALPFRFLDLEWEADRLWLARPRDAPGPVRVVSSHLTSPASRAPWERRLEELATVEGVGKLVFPCSVSDLLSRVLPQVSSLSNRSATVHTTGGSGPLLRVWARRFGFPLVFAALPSNSSGPERPRVESSQIPVDRLAPYLRAEGVPPLYGVVGHPVNHSLSPSLPHRWMGAMGRTGLYVALEMDGDEEFLTSLGPLADNGFRGLNVTLPFKEAAYRAASRCGRSAEACRAANCLTFRDDEVEAENTDLGAMLRRLSELRDAGRWDDRSVAVVGTGGAARATLAALRTLGARTTVYGRRPERAHALAREFGAEAGSVHDPPVFSLVVHATSVGRNPERTLDLPLQRILRPGSHLVDWVYAPDAPTVRDRALAAGASYEDGWRLLVYQAAATYAIWWGDEPPERQLQDAIAEGPCAA